jgi:hypothetical protein
VTHSLQAKPERAPELQVPVKPNAARQGIQQLS